MIMNYNASRQYGLLAETFSYNQTSSILISRGQQPVLALAFFLSSKESLMCPTIKNQCHANKCHFCVSNNKHKHPFKIISTV